MMPRRPARAAPMKIAIVTDDLTSATDGAAGFAERGSPSDILPASKA